MGADGHRFRLVWQEANSSKCPLPSVGSTAALLGSTATHPGGEAGEAMVMSQPHPLQDPLSPPSCLPMVPLVLCFNIKFQKVVRGLGLPRDEP